MTSLFRKATSLGVAWQMPLRQLITLESMQISKRLTAKDWEEHKRFLISLHEGGDPYKLASERARANIVRALADGQLAAYLVGERDTITSISAEAWFIETEVTGDDGQVRGSYRNFLIGLVEDVWPKASFGPASSERFSAKRVGRSIIFKRIQARRWLARSRATPEKPEEKCQRDPKDHLKELDLVNHPKGKRKIYQGLREHGFTRRQIESLDWGNLKKPGRPRK